MSTPNDGERIPAFPETWGNSDSITTNPGMTLRQYAAIKLRVPDSGIDWLDEMIVKANRDHLAGQWLTGIAADSNVVLDIESYAEWSYEIADAMLAERVKR